MNLLKKKEQKQDSLTQELKSTKEFEDCSIKYTRVENTPFTIVQNKDEFQITVGNNLIIRETFKSQKEAEERCKKIDWELLNAVIAIYAKAYAELIINNKKQTK